MARPRIYPNDAARQRAYRLRKKLKEGYVPPVLPAGPPVTKIPPKPKGPLPWTATDTRSWTWDRWARYFRGKNLLPHQIENLCEFDSGPAIDLDPRQHGKSTYVVEIFIERKLCESVYYTVDRPIIYISSSRSNIKSMTNAVRDTLYYETKITDFYGELIDYERIKGRQTRAPQTQYEINLVNRNDPYLKSFRAVTIDTRIRGGNTHWTIVDDPIDIREELNPEAATVKFMEWLKNKIIPLTKGNLLVIGTRYGLNDIYVQLRQLKIFKWIQRQAILGPIPGFMLPDHEPFKPHEIQVLDECHLLAPELWETKLDDAFRTGTPAQNIIYKLHIMGERAFKQEFQNDPIPRDSLIKWDWLEVHDVLPEDNPELLNYAVFLDDSSGETGMADYTALSFVVQHGRRYFIRDLLHGRWSPLVKVQKIEEFIENNARSHGIDRTSIKFCIEVVHGTGADVYQLIRDRSWITPFSINPKGRGKKEDRIMNNFGAEVEAKRVSIYRHCRNQRQFKQEIDSFPHGKHEHLMDATDQAIWWLKKKEEQYVPLSGKTSSRFTARPSNL